MHKNTIRKIADSLKKVAQSASLPIGENLQGIQFHHGTLYSLPNEASQLFHEQISLILKQKDFAEKFSERYINNKVQEILVEILNDNSINVEERLRTLLEEFSLYNTAHIVYLRVDGITLSEPLEIGRVKLFYGTDEIFEEWSVKSEQWVETLKNNEESKDSLLHYTQQVFNNEFKGHCIASVEVIAEPTRADERAKDEVRRVIDILRFASKGIHPLAADIRIGIKGEYPVDQRSVIMWDRHQFCIHRECIGSPQTFVIDQHSISRMNAMGIFYLSNALKKKQATNFEETLIRAIHWFSTALVQQEIENAFLYLIISLETLFTSEKGDPISNRVAESTAFIVGKNDSQARRNIKSQIKKYYGTRSGVAHGGNKSVSQADMLNLMNIVGSTIMLLIAQTDHINSQTQLMTSIEDMKFS